MVDANEFVDTEFVGFILARIPNRIFSPELSFQVVGSESGVGEILTNECRAWSPVFRVQSEVFLASADDDPRPQH